MCSGGDIFRELQAERLDGYGIPEVGLDFEGGWMVGWAFLVFFGGIPAPNPEPIPCSGSEVT